jgi:hypothetical protein
VSLLAREEHLTLNITGAGGTVLSYTNNGDTPRITICRVALGNTPHPIAGSTTYAVAATINGRRISPDSRIVVPAGVINTVVQSRELLIAAGDVVRVFVIGPNTDLAVYTLAELMDLTPITRAETVGSGAIAVDHNYGGAEQLAFQTADHRGIENATVQAFLAVDWNAGRRTANYVQGATTTISQGHWLSPIMLDPGSYVLLYFREGVYKPSTRTITVG